MPTWTPDVTSDTSGSTQEITVAPQNPAAGSEGNVTDTRAPNIIGSSDSVTYSEYEDLSALLLEEMADIATSATPNIPLNATYRVALDLSAIDISGANLLIDLRKWAYGHQNTDTGVTSTTLGSVLTEVTGSDKADFIIGTDRADTLNGGGGNDRLVGGKGDDTLNSGAGKDILDGGAGNDVLDGGAGSDQISGWAGNDTIILDLDDAGSDTVAHFGMGSNKIRVDSTAGSETTLSALGLARATRSGNTYIYEDDNGTSGFQEGSDTLHMTLVGFTGWSDSTHLEVV